MSTPSSTDTKPLNFRRYKDGDAKPLAWQQEIFDADHSHKCPTYIQSTPPCQGSCPSGEDIRGYLNIVRGIEKPPAGVPWQEYAWRRLTEANPLPSVMGRVCPAPCESGCNRNQVEDYVGINSVERFLGDEALKQGWRFAAPQAESGKHVLVVGAGVIGLEPQAERRRHRDPDPTADEQQRVGLDLGGPERLALRDELEGHRVVHGHDQPGAGEQEAAQVRPRPAGAELTAERHELRGHSAGHLHEVADVPGLRVVDDLLAGVPASLGLRVDPEGAVDADTQQVDREPGQPQVDGRLGRDAAVRDPAAPDGELPPAWPLVRRGGDRRGPGRGRRRLRAPL